MYRFISLILSILLFPVFIVCMPSYPNLITLDDGTQIFIKGDENCKWGLTRDGHTILPKDNKWVYAKLSESGFAEPSDIYVCSTNDPVAINDIKNIKVGIPVKKENFERNTIHHSYTKTRQSSNAVKGDRKALVVLMSFSDLDFIKSNNEFERLFNEEGYSEDGAIGSVHDYFSWASYGQLNFTCDVLGPFKANHDMKYYGKNIGANNSDQHPKALFDEAIEYVRHQVELSDYDSNGDGILDNIHIIFAGYGEESGAKSDAIWSHEMTFPAIEVDNIIIDRYSCAPELRGRSGNGISRIGPHCHEMGHALGAMDYYDVDYSTNGSFDGTGNWDIMASGSWNNEGISPPDFNPYVKIFDFGWANPQKLNDGYNEIQPSFISNDQIFMITTQIDDDFYLIQNRQQYYFDAAIPGNGLVIFHIGPEINTRKLTNNINSYFPQQCYIVCASSNSKFPDKTSSSYGDINSDGCPFPGTSENTEFSDSSIPASYNFNGLESGINLSEISINESVVTLYNGTPPTPIYLWSENFESIVSWNMWNNEGGGWKTSLQESHISNALKAEANEKSPIIHDSNYIYSQYSYSFNKRESIRVIETPFLRMDNDKEYILKFEYFNSPQIVSNASNKNTLHIYLKCDDSLIPLEILSNTNNDWVYKEVIISQPASNVTTQEFSIVFEGHGLSTGYICIDNITLEEKNTTGITEIPHPDTSDIKIYNLNGICIEDEDMLGPGIYIRRHGIKSEKFIVR